jgi:hypothetical protein
LSCVWNRWRAKFLQQVKSLLNLLPAVLRARLAAASNAANAAGASAIVERDGGTVVVSVEIAVAIAIAIAGDDGGNRFRAAALRKSGWSKRCRGAEGQSGEDEKSFHFD